MSTSRRAPLPPAIRTVVRLCGSVLLVDTIFYAVLSPLLAGYAEQAHIDHSGVGLLVAAYPLGMVATAIPAGAWASRNGPRAVMLTGVLVTALTCLLFATASTGATLVAFRFLQGAGGALSWTASMVWVSSVAPPDRRGELVGRLLGLAVIGGMLGPAVGALATLFGTVPVFAGIAVLCLGLAAVATRQPRPTMAETAGWEGALGLMRDRRVRIGLWLTALGGAGFGVINTTAPLSLERFGLTALQTSAVFLVMAACGALTSPRIGRLIDLHGRAPVTLVLLVVAAVTVTATGLAAVVWLLLPLLVLAATSLEAIYVPGGTLVMDGTAAADIAGGEILALNNLIWASGMALASVLSGVTSTVVGQAAPYYLVACAALGTVPFVLRLRRGAPAPSTA